MLALATIIMTSCCHSIYPIKSLNTGYAYAMTSEEDVEIREQIHIFLTEKELVNADYSVISINSYKPFTILPFQKIFIKKMNKKFFAQAVKKTYEEGGNAVLVTSPGTFAVLNVTNWNGHEPKASFENPIFDTGAMDAIKASDLRSKKRRERVLVENTLMDEIETNISCAKTLEEIAFIREKNQALADYNLEKPQKGITKAVNKNVKKLNAKEKAIKKLAEKKAKEAAKKK